MCGSIAPTNAETVNKTMKKKLVQCATEVKRDAVSRKVIDGVEHIVVSSSTLPDNIVMNGGLYPADEIEKGFMSLERTLAPLEHPQSDGLYISATDPSAINNYYAGAYNENVRRENGRVHVDKVINVAEAMKSERGKRILDRVSEIEKNEQARPIHTSVGVFVTVDALEEPAVNDAGQEYTWVARDMVFDHDAILLDSVGAAQPNQGVGMAVNAEGDQFEVVVVEVPVESQIESGVPSEAMGLSISELEAKLFDLVNQPPLSADYIADVFPEKNQIVYSLGGEFFTVPYSVGNGTVNLTGIPVRMVVEKTYTPATNNDQGDNAMRELMLKALADAGITVNAEITDEVLLAEYNKLSANDSETGDKEELAAIVANALAPITEELKLVKSQITANAEDEKSKYAELVGNSDKFPGLTADAAKKLDTESLKAMAASCQAAHGVPSGMPVVNSGSEPYKMPGEE